MYHDFLGGITAETNFDLILSGLMMNVSRLSSYFWFRLSVYPVHSKTELICRELS